MYLMPKNFFNNDYFLDTLNSSKMLADVYEDDKYYYIDVDIPGFKKEDISIDLENNYLIINAFKEQDNQHEYIRHERISKNYNRSFYVGNIEVEDIDAVFSDGILKIKITKNEEKTRKSIDIK